MGTGVSAEDWQVLDSVCDHCGHLSQVRWRKLTRQLTLCSHHSNELELPLTVSGWHIAEDVRTSSSDK